MEQLETYSVRWAENEERVEPGIDFESFFFLEFLSAPLDTSQPLSLRRTSTNKRDWRMEEKEKGHADP